MSSQDPGFPPGITAGSLGRRVLAHVIDSAPLALIGAGTGFAVVFVPRDDLRLVLGLVGGLLGIAWVVFLWWTQGTRGASPGMRLMNLEVVAVENGRPIGWLRAILRSVVFGALAGTSVGLVLMLILLVLNPRRQGWHDLVGRAVVINARQPDSATDRSRPDPRLVGLPPSTGGAGTVGLPASLGGSPSGMRPPAPTGPGSQQFGLPGAHGYQAQGVAGSQPGLVAPGAGAPAAPEGYGQSSQPGGAAFGQPGQFGGASSAASAPPGPHPGGAPGSPASAPAPGGPITGVPFGQFGSAGSGGAPTVAGTATVPPPGVMPGSTPAGYSEPGVVVGVPAPGAPGTPSPFGAPPVDDEGMDSTRLVQRTGNQRRPDQGWVVVLGDGRQVSVESLVLIGRNPQPRAGEEGAELVSVQDNSRTVSKTHIAVGVDARGIWVMDRGSTNGSAIATSSGQFEPCAAGDQVRVREGQVVSFGDQRFEVRRTYPAQF